jgi:hypothetical protein
MGETTRTQISSWVPGSRRRSLVAWAAVIAILVLSWGAYAGTLLSLMGFDLDWRGIVCGGEYLPASCAPKSGWRKFEMIITLAQLVVLPFLTFKGVKFSRSRASNGHQGPGSTAAGCFGCQPSC